ncbi:MAG: haloacid dehalogenase type II [Pseudomonadota bacterium]
MASIKLDGIEACVFDAYGTLFDFNSATERCRADLGEKADALSALWRTKQLEYTWLRSLMGDYVPFWQVTGEALDFAMESLGLDDRVLRDKLMDLYMNIEAFPEVPSVLKALRDGGRKIAILSNGSPEMLEAGAKHSGIDGLLDANLSVDDVGIFKPDRRVYQLACDRLGVAAERISFQSSNAWDAHGASAFGFRVAWVNRYGQRRERLPGAPDVELTSLTELPPVLGL